MPLISILDTSIDLSFVHWVGILIALSGILIETIADIQLSKFKLDQNNINKVMDKGLWYYSRHPNYFGDSLFWWGITIYCFALSNNLLIFIAPIIMTYLLLRVSGVTMLENRLSKKKDGYTEYINSTSSFIILPKKKSK